jgi:hypothetical protein
MSYFSTSNAYYIDASSGGSWPSWDALNNFFTPYFASGPARRRDLLPAAHRRRRPQRHGGVRGRPRLLRPRAPHPRLGDLRQQPQDHPLDRLLGRTQFPHPEHHRQHLPRGLQGLRAARQPGGGARRPGAAGRVRGGRRSRGRRPDVLRRGPRGYGRPHQGSAARSRSSATPAPSASSCTASPRPWSTSRAAPWAAATSGRRPRAQAPCAAALSGRDYSNVAWPAS